MDYFLWNQVIRYIEESFLATMEERKPYMPRWWPVIISDTPGMRKSILLAEVTRKLEAKSPERYILYLSFGEWVAELTIATKQSSLTTATIEDSLLCHC